MDFLSIWSIFSLASREDCIGQVSFLCEQLKSFQILILGNKSLLLAFLPHFKYVFIVIGNLWGPITLEGINIYFRKRR